MCPLSLDMLFISLSPKCLKRNPTSTQRNVKNKSGHNAETKHHGMDEAKPLDILTTAHNKKSCVSSLRGNCGVTFSTSVQQVEGLGFNPQALSAFSGEPSSTATEMNEGKSYPV